MPPVLKNVTRLDSTPVNQTFFTEEGYLRDMPVLTSTGIFEYANPDGSLRRELRLPEDVFDTRSLESYEGKPIIITHDAGLVDKSNVHRFQIGTILSSGIQSGNDVRAKIIIATDRPLLPLLLFPWNSVLSLCFFSFFGLFPSVNSAKAFFLPALSLCCVS